MRIKQKSKKRGFTLVELLVVTGIFSTIIIVIVSIFVSLIQLERKVVLTKKAMAEANYALEFMGRALRTAQKDLDGACLGAVGLNYKTSNSNQRIRFINGNEGGECQEFFWEEGQIKFQQESGLPVPLTSPEITISDLRFYPQGESQEDQRQPLVTIAFTIEIPGSKPLHFQTSVSQRNPDVKY